MEFISTQDPQDNTVYNDALHQLHKSNMFLQEMTQNLMKEQAMMFEKMTRIQVDLEVHKESQNDRLDEMMRNVDSEVKKVYKDLGQDCEKLNAKLLETKDECIEAKEYNDLKTDFEELKLIVKSKATNHNKEDSILNAKVGNMEKDCKAFKKEIDKKLVDNLIGSEKIKASIEESCIQKLEAYIGTEILEEIVATINQKLNHVKTEFQGELEQNKIKIDDLNTVFINLKHKVADIENPRRCFNESDIYTAAA